jgi:hypothetical protein
MRVQDSELVIIAQGRRTFSRFLQRNRFSMSLEWFHAVLGAFFVGVWLIVGQIVAADRSGLRH